MAQKDKRKKLVLGLSSVSRRQNYLFATVSSLVTALSDRELRDVVIVILDVIFCNIVVFEQT